MRFIIAAQLMIRMKKIVSFVNVREISSQLFRNMWLDSTPFVLLLPYSTHSCTNLSGIRSRLAWTSSVIRYTYKMYIHNICAHSICTSLRISFNRYLIILPLYKFFKRVLFLPNIVLLSLINPSHVYVMHAYTRVCMYARVYYKCIHIYTITWY